MQPHQRVGLVPLVISKPDEGADAGIVSRINPGELVNSWKRSCCMTICSAPCANAKIIYGQKCAEPRSSGWRSPESGSASNARMANSTPAGAVQANSARQSKCATSWPPTSGASALLSTIKSRKARVATGRCCVVKLIWIRMRQVPIIGPMK